MTSFGAVGQLDHIVALARCAASAKMQGAVTGAIYGEIALAQYVHADQCCKVITALQAETKNFVENERECIGRSIIRKQAYPKKKALRMAKAVRRLKRAFAVRLQT